jgi:hypothetical protein
MSEDKQRRPALTYVSVAAAATAAAVALYAAATYVDWFRAVLEAPGIAGGTSGPGLKYALCFAAPATLWAAAFARLAPRAALRLAGVFAQKWFVYVVVALSTAGVAYTARAVLGEGPLTGDESASVFQSKIFCRGKLAAPAPTTEADIARAFFRSPDEVVRFGRWFSAAAPLHPALLCLGRAAGWPKLIPVLAAAVTLCAVYFTGRRALGPFGGALAAVLAATSPLFIFTQASYLPEASFLAFFALALWFCLRAADAPTRVAMAAAGAAAGAAFLTSEYSAFYLALPFGWFLWGRLRANGARANRAAWLVAGAAPFVAAWMLYNWRQTGNVFLPPRFFADAPYFGFDAGYTFADALSKTGRGVVALSTEAFGWPLLCLVPALVRLFWKPSPNDFEKALYAAALLTFLAQLPLRDAGAGGAGLYYPSWFCLTFITARFFVILAAKAQRGFKGAGEGLAAFVLTSLMCVNAAACLPRVASYYRSEARRAASSPWADGTVNRAVAAVVPGRAVVIIKPRSACTTSMSGSPFLDDRVAFARDNGELNRQLVEMFPGREVYLLDYPAFVRTGEITQLDIEER